MNPEPIRACTGSIEAKITNLRLDPPPSASQTPREKLIEALRTSSDALYDPSLSQHLTAVELAIYLGALLKMPHLANHKQLVLGTVLELAHRFTTMKSGSVAQWNKLTAVIAKNFMPDELIEVVESKDQSTTNLEKPFVYETWTRLSNGYDAIFPIFQLDIHPDLFQTAIPSWVKAQELSSATNSVLLMTFYMVMPGRPDSWTIKHLTKNPIFQDCIVEALTYVEDAGYRLLAKFCKKGWQLAPDLTENSLHNLAYILYHTPNTVFDPAICIQVLNNPCEDKEKVKLRIVHYVLYFQEILDITFLQTLLQGLDSYKKEAHIKKIVETIMGKKWTSALFTFSYELKSDMIADSYRNQTDSFLKHLNELHPETNNEVEDHIRIKYIDALIDSLLDFSNTNKEAMRKITSPRALEHRLNTSVAIKAAALQLLFTLYNALHDQEKKAITHKELCDTLKGLTVTPREKKFPEFTVDVPEAASPCLRFTYKGKTYQIA